MKEKLESELMDIAIKILNLKGSGDVHKLYIEVSKLQEKLAVLKFVQEKLENQFPTVGHDSSFFDMLDAAFNNKVSDTIEVEDKTYVDLDNSDQEEIVEPVMETIKDIVAQMPYETQQVDNLFDKIKTNETQKKQNLEDYADDYKTIPEFEPIKSSETKTSSTPSASDKKSLNDKLKSGGLHIGLNDKLAFIKHLFNNGNADYERVLSQLNTLNTFSEATNFITNIVKPDYNNWVNKEDYENRFMQIIESKYL